MPKNFASPIQIAFYENSNLSEHDVNIFRRILLVKVDIQFLVVRSFFVLTVEKWWFSFFAVHDTTLINIIFHFYELTAQLN